MYLRVLYVNAIIAGLNGLYAHEIDVSLPCEELAKFREKCALDKDTDELANHIRSTYSMASSILKYMYIQTVLPDGNVKPDDHIFYVMNSYPKPV
jgi:hypothetical protein